jgi:hypothetical protein
MYNKLKNNFIFFKIDNLFKDYYKNQVKNI